MLGFDYCVSTLPPAPVTRRPGGFHKFGRDFYVGF